MLINLLIMYINIYGKIKNWTTFCIFFIQDIKNPL
jgi:hypothetical protein